MAEEDSPSRDNDNDNDDRIVVVPSPIISDMVPSSPIHYHHDDDRHHHHNINAMTTTTNDNDNDHDHGGQQLAIATAVSDEDEYIYAAVEYDPNSKPPLYRNRRFRVYAGLALLVITSVISVVVVYVTRGTVDPTIVEENIKLEDLPTYPPTTSPVTYRMRSGIRDVIESGVLSRGVTFDDIIDDNDDDDDPRLLALDWILHDDDMMLMSDDDNLYQRYVLALLAFAFDSEAWRACGYRRRVVDATTTTTTNTNANTNTNTNTTDAGEEEEEEEEDRGSVVDYENCEVVDANTGVLVERKSWLSSASECEWHGVICSGDGVVRGLELIGNGLIGDIPPEISRLRFLEYLALNGNCLYGTIPPEIGNMSNLLSLELHGNGLSGTIPPEMYDAEALQLLNLALQSGYSVKCVMSNGTIVDTYWRRGGTTTTTRGGTYDVNPGLEGEVLGPNVGRWKSMKGLYLFDNSFGGMIDESIGDLKYLIFLRAHNNGFSGVIPVDIVRLDGLRDLHLNSNDLYSDIPYDIGYMTNLEVLRVGENEMFGVVPDSVYGLHKLRELWLQDTVHCVNTDGYLNCEVDMDYGFEGSIRTEIGSLTKLEMLLVNNNPLTGTIPTEIGMCEDLAVLHIHKTYIEGSAPMELCLLRDKKLNSETGKGVFYADCRPNNRTGDPFFSCDCCSDCCDHTTQVCIADD